MPDSDSTNESAYSGPTHDNMCRMIRQGLEELEEKRLKHHIYDRRKKVVLALLEKAHEPPRGSIYTPVFQIVEQATVKVYFTVGTDEMLDDMINKLAGPHDSPRWLVPHLITSCTSAVLVTRFLKQKTEKSGASKAKLR